MRIGLDISVLNDRHPTGIAVYTHSLIRNLLEVNKTDKFILFGIVPKSRNNLKNIDLKKYPNVELKIFELPLKMFRLTFLSWQKIGWPTIDQLIGPVDIFHSFNWFFPPQKNGKKVATIFDLTAINNEQWHQAKNTQLEKLRISRVANLADLTITISESAKKDFLKINPKNKVEVIYPGVGEEFHPIGKKKKQNYFLSVATLEPRKNLERIIRAFKMYVSRGPAGSVSRRTSSHSLRALRQEPSPPSPLETELLIVGSKGWLTDEIYDLPKKMGIGDKVKFLGRVDDKKLPALYSGAIALVFPSLYEGFGIPILEAQACGCPVITSNISSMPEVANKSAILVDPTSVEDIAKVMERVQETGERERLVEAGFKNVKKFSWKKSALKLNQLYNELINNTQRKIGG